MEDIKKSEDPLEELRRLERRGFTINQSWGYHTAEVTARNGQKYMYNYGRLVPSDKHPEPISARERKYLDRIRKKTDKLYTSTSEQTLIEALRDIVDGKEPGDKK